MTQEEKDLIERIREAQRLMMRLSSLITLWIRVRIRLSTPIQLLTAERDLWDLARRPLDEKVPSKGKQQLILNSHLLYKLLFDERIRREKQYSSLNPSTYYGPLHELTDKEIREYLIWKSDSHGTVPEWRKEKNRTLPILINNEKENNTNNSRLSQGGEGIISEGSNIQHSPESNIKTKVEGETRAYGPRRKG